MESNKWAAILHLSVFAGYFVPLAGLLAPLIIWQMKKNEIPDLDAHGRIVMNFIISFFIYGIIAFLLCFVFIGIPIAIALSIAAIVLPIIGGIKANDGIVWKYPGTISFL